MIVERVIKPGLNRDAQDEAIDNFVQARDDVRSQLGSTDSTQVGGTHYTSLSVQPWAAMESWMAPAEFAGFLRGNVIKYIARAGKKRNATMEDLKKAQHYLNKLIEFESGVTQSPAVAKATPTV